jgi:tRNA A37 threonylcarbamoyladenosine synthetase subunit TsaC/SUA5/YrdC
MFAALMKHIQYPAVPAHERVREHARQVFDVLAAGGMAVTHLDVAYAIMARGEASVRRMYVAKTSPRAAPLRALPVSSAISKRTTNCTCSMHARVTSCAL